MKFLDWPKRRVEPERPAARRRHPKPTLAERDLRTAWQAVSLLLEYPTGELVALVPALQDACASLPPGVGRPLMELATHVAASDLAALQSEYVATFDTTRKCALHLTYYAHGDTRKRGIALVQFKQAFRRGGLEVTESELPDHLCVVCEFGATGEVAIAWQLLNDHRAGIELLHLALTDRRSPWLAAVTALRNTLPELDGTQAEAVARLLFEGPPNEDVGLDAYSLDPRLNPHPDADAADLQGALR